MKEKYYFTFCSDDEENCNHYVVFEGTYDEARKQMVDRFGTHWAFQYSEEDFAGQAEEYGLTRVY